MAVRCHVEIMVRLNLNNKQNLHLVLRQFAANCKGWIFPAKESETYRRNIGTEGGYLICEQKGGVKPSLVAIATAKDKRPNTYYVPNIVPRDRFELSIAEYNAVGEVFVRDFREWLKKSDFDGSVRCTGSDKTLADIIPGPKCRQYFERFLQCDVWNSHSLPSHPSDIEKLDIFICALFRFGADVHTEEIERFLIADKEWQPSDAAWVRHRIDVGLDILRMDRQF